MEVIAETKFLFSGDKSAVVHSWEGYGLKLHVPEGSTADFRARIVRSTKFILPEETELVSQFYWVTSKGKLTGPVGVEIQHCAQIEEKDTYGLKFAAHKLNTPQSPYVFKKLNGQFSSTSSYRREIEFSNWYFATIAEKVFGIKPVFNASLYYFSKPSKSRHDCVVHIVVVPNWESIDSLTRRHVKVHCSGMYMSDMETEQMGVLQDLLIDLNL